MAGIGVAAALCAGLGLSSLLVRDPDRLPQPAAAVVFGVVAVWVWQVALDVIGATWSPALLGVPALGGLVLYGLAGRPVGWRGSAAHGSGWRLVAGTAVAAQCVAVAARPAFGWDFRYNWGLKAKVFASGGGHDVGWLTWSGHGFAHPDYPPLWPDLLAWSAAWGAEVSAAAAAWAAVLAAALAVVCWRGAERAPVPVRALAAVVGGWAPVILAPWVDTSGYAEPLLALFAAVALIELARGTPSWNGRLTLTAAVVGLALTKNEGFALAVGVGLAALVFGAGRGRGLPLLTAVGVFAAWRAVVAAAGIPGEAVVWDAARVVDRALRLPGALVETAGPPLTVLGLVWLGLAVALRGRGAVAVWSAVAVWISAVLAAYLVSPHGLAWHLQTSLPRVLAVPVPGLLAVALGRAWAAARPAGSDRRRGRGVDFRPREAYV